MLVRSRLASAHKIHLIIVSRKFLLSFFHRKETYGRIKIYVTYVYMCDIIIPKMINDRLKFFRLNFRLNLDLILEKYKFIPPNLLSIIKRLEFITLQRIVRLVVTRRPRVESISMGDLRQSKSKKGGRRKKKRSSQSSPTHCRKDVHSVSCLPIPFPNSD